MNPREVRRSRQGAGSLGCLLFKDSSDGIGGAFRPAKQPQHERTTYHEKNSPSTPAVVGLDVHPDTFAGAILRGRDPATARVEHTSTRVPLDQLEAWACAIPTRVTPWSWKPAPTPLPSPAGCAPSNGRHRPGQPPGGPRRQGVLRQRPGGCRQDRTHPPQRPLHAGLAARPENPGAARGLQRVSIRGQGSDPPKQQIRAMLNEHCVRLPAGFRLAHPTPAPTARAQSVEPCPGDAP